MIGKLLKDLVVIDLGVGMAPALVAKFLVELGANVVRVEPPEGDPFAAHYPAYEVWRRGETVDVAAQHSSQKLDVLLADADVCLIGGEDHPSLARRGDAVTIVARHPQLVALEIEGYPLASKHAGRPATDVLIQAHSGIVFEHYPNRPNLMSFSPSAYGSALRGLVGVLAALYEREASGKGQLVSTSLFEGATYWVSGLWQTVSQPTDETRYVMPKGLWPLILRCADGVYVHLNMGSAGAKYKLYRALEIDDPTVEPGARYVRKPGDPVKNFFGDWDLLAGHCARMSSKKLLERVWAEGLPGEPVLPPGACWDDPQVRHNGTIVTDRDNTRRVGMPISGVSHSSQGKPSLQSGVRPLEGIRVVDFGAFVMGPIASAVLCDLGADVIKVEPVEGDANRNMFRSFSPSNKGKRSIRLDLKHPVGRRVAQAMCARADIVTSNFRSGVSRKLGIDPENLHELKGDLIVCESPAYGYSGPLKERAGFDLVIQALCGHEYRAGGADSPLWNRTTMVDYAGGLLGAIACLLGLLHRARTGDGMTVWNPLLSSGIFLMSELIQRMDGQFGGGDPINDQQTGFHPAECLYQTEDEWIALSVRGKAMSASLSSVLGVDLPIDPLRWTWVDADVISKAVAHWKIDELLIALDIAGVWAERCVQTGESDFLADPDMEMSNAVHVANHPEYGEVREIGPQLRFSRSKVGHDGYAPMLSEHKNEILAELDFSESELAVIVESNAVL